jgi:hypothetical protein
VRYANRARSFNESRRASGMEIESFGWTLQCELERVKVARKGGRRAKKKRKSFLESGAKITFKSAGACSAFPLRPRFCKRRASAVCARAVACAKSTHGPMMMMRCEKKRDFELNKYV